MSRFDLRPRLRRVRRGGRTLIQCAVAACIAWELASLVPHHPRPYFAPVAAVVALNLSLGQRARRAVEVAAGVAVGVLVADLLVRLVGVGGWQIGLGVLIAMTIVVTLGGSPLAGTQAASAAVLITAVPLAPGAAFYGRFIDAVIGGAVAITISLALPLRPAAVVRRASEPLLQIMIEQMRRSETAFAQGDPLLAESALDALRRTDALVRDLETGIAAAVETARIAPSRRGSRDEVMALATMSVHLDRAMRNQRVLLRRGARMLHDDPSHAAELAPALRALTSALESIELAITAQDAFADARDHALEAVALADASAAPGHDLSHSVVVAQVRSIAVDILQATGLSQPDALQLIRS